MSTAESLRVSPFGIAPARSIPAWQLELQHAFRDTSALLAHLGLDPSAIPTAQRAARDFPLRVPRPFVARMRPGDPQDPLLLQVLPGRDEDAPTPGFDVDPVGDLARLKDGGVIHKYHGRALLIATGACAVHCRYCFRRHFPYGDAQASKGQWRDACARIAADPSLDEVILSGGDPLSLSDDKLAELSRQLDGIGHLRRLRLHTRQPVVLPQRVDAALLAWLSASRLSVVMVLHVNHANEIDADVADACRALAAVGVRLLNQSVLLRGINDDADALVALSEKLFACGVLPYYLHVLDRVQGAAHFEVNEAMAKQLMRSVSARLPGYLVPRLARETAGEPAKQVIAW